MLHNLEIVATALLPIFVLIGLGHLLYRFDFPNASFWPQLERLVYFLLLPALLIEALATAEVNGARALAVAAAVVLTISAMAALLLVLRGRFPLDGPGFTSIFQGGIRFNSYLGIAAALSLYGPDGAAVAAMASAVMIPLINVYCVAVLSHHASAKASPRTVLRGIVRNPLIVSCVIGIALNVSGIGLPYGSEAIMESVGRASLPLGLMTVGAGLQLRSARGRGGVLLAISALKLAVMPLLALGVALLLGMTPLETRVLVLFGALPTATSSYILARQMGGDAPLMAAVLTAQTALSFVTLPFVLLLLGSG